MSNIDYMVEAWTRQLHDEYFDPKIACDWCDKSFRESGAFESEYTTTLTFCSEECVTEWEQEQKEQGEKNG